MTQRLLQLAAVLLFASLVLGSVEKKGKIPIKVENCVVVMKTAKGNIEVPFKEVFDAAMQEYKDREYSVNTAKLTKRN